MTSESGRTVEMAHAAALRALSPSGLLSSVDIMVSLTSTKELYTTSIQGISCRLGVATLHPLARPPFSQEQFHSTQDPSKHTR